MMTIGSRRVVCLVGPTGTGKSEAAFCLARRVPSVLVSADAMQIYKGMDIVTDKPPRIVLRKFVVKMIDVAAPAREYNVAEFCRAARLSVAAALKAGKLPIVVGGTGLYVKALLDGIFEGKSEDPRVRAKLNQECAEKGVAALYERLAALDPEAAQKIGPHNARRIVRALEVYAVTRHPISALQKNKRGLRSVYDVRVFGLTRDRADLYDRIEQRVDAMVQNGLLDEVRRLLKKKLSKTASCCIGVREVEGFLKGAYGLDEAVRLIKRNTRHYAKRQMTWFGRDKTIEWIPIGKNESLELIVEKILSQLNQKNDTKQVGPILCH